MSWFAGFEPICRPDAPLAPHTWYRLGGPARWLIEPRDETELVGVLARCRDAGIRWRVLGQGANVLVRDEGFDGVVLRLVAPAFAQTVFDGVRVIAGAGVDFPKLIREAVARGLIGLEALAGIPGTVGGVTRMNAGGKHGEVRQFVRSARVLEPSGDLRPRDNAAIGFAYRRSELGGCIVVATEFELTEGDRDEALARHKRIWNEKYDTQPPVSARTAGCVFRNPTGHSAGRLIDQCGLKSARIGGAEVSPRHANFVVAHNGASARDVLSLIEHVQQQVQQRTGVSLETEVEIW